MVKMYSGVALEPTSRAVIGSQQVPFIYEDRVSKEDFIQGLLKLYNMSEEERAKLGALGRAHVEKNFNPEDLLPQWDELFQKIYKEKGSWQTRQHKRWTLSKIA